MIKPIKKDTKDINIYIVFELKEEKDEWYNVAEYSTLAEAIDFIKKVREWEKRWKELGFAYAPKAAIYKIVEFKNWVEFIEQ